MEDGNIRRPQDKQVRKLASFVRKLSDEEINIFLTVLGALMAQVPAPKDARKSYLKEVEVRLRNNGVEFLAKSRVFPTFGLKLLGNDRDGFPIPGFKSQKGKVYPSLFAWYWGELDRLSGVKKPSKADVQRAQRVLCVLSFAKMIKANSVNQIRKSLTDFERRVDPEGSSVDYFQMLKRYESNGEKAVSDMVATYVPNMPPELLRLAGYPVPEEPEEPDGYYDRPDSPSLKEILGFKHNLAKLPQYLDLDSFSTKPCALKGEPRFPEWYDRGGPCDFGYKPPPYGRVHVLTESAGKTRLICPYNTPFVHSTGLYSRSRSILDFLRQDYSADQAAGHRFVKQEIASGRHWCVSADLSNFSDDISPDLAAFGLRSLGLGKLGGYLFNLPVMLPNRKFLIPDKLLMGLKGCFELSSVCHHYVVQLNGIKNYAMVGDDLFYSGKIDTYLKAIEPSGWKLNRSKTVYSKTVAVFCGEMYWFGHRVSPRVPKVSSCFYNGKRLKASTLFPVVRCSIEHLNTIYSRRSVVAVMRPLLQLLRRSWKSVIAYHVPQKLRGLGLRSGEPGVGLLQLLSRRDVLRMSKLSIGIKKEQVSGPRWFGLPIELAPNRIKPEFAFLPTLLKKGAVQLSVPKSRPAARKDVRSLNLSDVLEWYYYGTRLEPNQFGL